MDRSPKPEAPDAFFAADMRVGRVLTVEPFPEARRPAFKLTVDFGDLGQRQTSAQVTHYSPEELTGRLVWCLRSSLNLRRPGVASRTSPPALLAYEQTFTPCDARRFGASYVTWTTNMHANL